MRESRTYFEEAAVSETRFKYPLLTLTKCSNTLRDIQQRADAANNSTSNLAFVRETPLPSLECIGSAPPFGHQQVRGLVESLQPQQWLSPSVMMPWNDWESMFTTFVERSG